MPPQGESMGIAIEDAMLISRLLSEQPDASIPDIIARYQRNRIQKIDKAFDEASWRWETVKDSGYVMTMFKEYLTTVFLWWNKDKLNKSWEFDIMKAELVD
jgi:2-polyprenyl-6-methoxyphenol hydroxylase-like FAD-dependent oxidoreductase